MIAYLPLIITALGAIVNLFHAPLAARNPRVAGILSDLFPIVQRAALRAVDLPPRPKGEVLRELGAIEVHELKVGK